MRFLAILLALYLTRATPPIAPVEPLPGPLVIAGSHTYAVIRLERWDGEATNMGGMHYAFSVDGLDPKLLVAAGGHGLTGDGLSLPGLASWTGHYTGRYYVAELALPAGLEDCLSTWGDQSCVGAANHLVPTRDLASARALLAAIPRTGYPAGELTLLPTM